MDDYKKKYDKLLEKYHKLLEKEFYWRNQYFKSKFTIDEKKYFKPLNRKKQQNKKSYCFVCHKISFLKICKNCSLKIKKDKIKIESLDF